MRETLPSLGFPAVYTHSRRTCTGGYDATEFTPEPAWHFTRIFFPCCVLLEEQAQPSQQCAKQARYSTPTIHYTSEEGAMELSSAVAEAVCAGCASGLGTNPPTGTAFPALIGAAHRRPPPANAPMEKIGLYQQRRAHRKTQAHTSAKRARSITEGRTYCSSGHRIFDH